MQMCHYKIVSVNYAMVIKIEDEMQFLLNCDFYEDLRRPLKDKAHRCNTDFAHLNNTDKIIF